MRTKMTSVEVMEAVAGEVVTMAITDSETATIRIRRVKMTITMTTRMVMNAITRRTRMLQTLLHVISRMGGGGDNASYNVAPRI